MKPAQTTEPQNAMLRAQEKHQVNRRIRSGAGREIKQVVEQKKITRKIKSQIKTGKEADAVTYTCPSCGAQI